MLLRTGPGEPAVERWRSWSLAAFAAALTAGPDDPPGRRRVVAIAGRSGGGKSTLARRLAAVVPDAAVVGTDDLAWHEPMFAWASAAVEEVLLPFRAGRAIDYRPPAWVARGRPGGIVVRPGVRVLFFEGIGASRREVVDQVDTAVWVQSDFVVAERRGIARDVEQGVNGDEAQSVAHWHWWMDQEIDFYAADRPWERADVVVAGNRDLPDDADQVMVADQPGPSR